jgi:hypothetical protein
MTSGRICPVHFADIGGWRIARALTVFLPMICHVAIAQVAPAPATFASRSAACERLLDTKQFKNAEACALDLQKTFPGRWAVYSLLGRADLGMGDKTQAAVYLRLALNVAPADQASSLKALLSQAQGGENGGKPSAGKAAGAGAGASPDAPRTSGPSLEDTLGWLNEHFSALQVSASKQENQTSGLSGGAYNETQDSFTFAFTSYSLRSCNISLNYERRDQQIGTLHFGSGQARDPKAWRISCSGQLTISLGNITDSHVESTTVGTVAPLFFHEDKSPIWAVLLSGRGSAVIDHGNCTTIYEASNQTSSAPVIGSYSKFSLYSRDQDIVERISRAFSHAAEMCRIKEPF